MLAMLKRLSGIAWVCAVITAAGASSPSLLEVQLPQGIDFVLRNSPTPQKYLIETMPGGVALLDYNGDGLLDTFVVNGGHIDSPMKTPERFNRHDPRYWNPKTCDFTASWANHFGQDRAAMAQDWGGLGGVEKEDAIMSLSMGPIFDRTREHLVAADQAVVRLRRRLVLPPTR